MPILLVIAPLSQVTGAVSVLVKSITVSLIIFPVSLIDVAVGMPKLALAISLVFLPLALVFAAIGPNLRAPALLHADLSCVPMVDGLRIWGLDFVDHDQV